MRSRARGVVSATLGMALVVGTGIPICAFGNDEPIQKYDLEILATLEDFDLDGDDVPDVLDLDDDGIADAFDWDHDGLADPIEAEDENSGSSDKEKASDDSEKTDDEASADEKPSHEGEEASESDDEATSESDDEEASKSDDEATSESDDETNADGETDADGEAAADDAAEGKDDSAADAKDEKSEADADADVDNAKAHQENKADSKEAKQEGKLEAAALSKDLSKAKEEGRLVVSSAIDLGESIIKGAEKEQAKELSSELMISSEEKLLSDVVAADVSSFLRLPSRSYDYTTAKFIATIGEQARQVAQKNDLYASVLIAQAVVESGNGNSLLAQAPNNNLFGIKGSYKGNSVAMPTQEDDGTGRHYNIVADFRRYGTHAESIADYADLLKSHPGWYKGAYKSNAKTYVDACKALQGVYATSTTYAATLVSVIEGYGLDRYDKPLDFKLSGSLYDPKSVKANQDGFRPATMDDYARLEALATSFIGTEYVWGGSAPSTGFDCSGLVQWCMKEALDIDLPRVTYAQQLVGKSVRVDADELRMGDLLFFNLPGEGVGHVAMYLGDGFYVHAPETGDVVKVTSIEEFTPSFARRVIDQVDLKR